jgi:hypothetical protein
MRALGLAFAFTPALVTAALVARFAVDVPTWDDFERAPFLAAWKEGRLGFHDFYALHIEHRIVVPRLLMLLNEAWLGDLRVENGFGVAILLAGALGVFGLLRRTLGPEPLRLYGLAFLCNLLWFSPLQWENLLWAIQTAFFLPFACAALALFALWTRAPAALKFAAAGAAAIVATHSFSHGLALWPLVFAAVVLKRDEPPRSRAVFLVAWLALAAAVLLPYFTVGGFRNESLHAYDVAVGERPGGLHLAQLRGRWMRAALFFLALLGSPLSRNPYAPEMEVAPYTGGLVAALFVAAAAVCVLRWRDARLFDRALPWLALGGYGLAASALAGIGRSFYLPWRGALLPHYATLGLVTLVGLVGLLAVLLDAAGVRVARAGPALRGVLRTAPAFAAGLLAGVIVLAGVYGVNGMYEWRSSRLQARTSLLYLQHFQPRYARRLDGQLQVARDYTRLLDDHGLMRPRLAPDLRLRSEFEIEPGELAVEAASVTEAAPRRGGIGLRGFAWLPEAGRRADGVLVTRRDAAGEPWVVALLELHGMPWMAVPRQDHLFNVVWLPGPREFGAFRGSVAQERLPEPGEQELEVWAVDADRMRVRRIAQTLRVRPAGDGGLEVELLGPAPLPGGPTP